MTTATSVLLPNPTVKIFLRTYLDRPSGSGQVPRAVLGETIDGAVVSDSAERMQLVAHAGDQRCLAHPLRDARDLLAAHPDRDEVVAMMTPLKAHLSWMIGPHARREALSASTWLQYRARARRDLLALALRPWTDEDWCAWPSASVAASTSG
jgi:hypothetical protein